MSNGKESFIGILFVTWFPGWVPGDEAALRELSACQSAFSETDSRGWIPLHEAATQKNQTILEVTFAGL